MTRMQKAYLCFAILMCWFLVLSVYLIVQTRNDLDRAFSAHVLTLEHIVAAQLALKDGRPQALLLASNSLDEARALSALYFSKNNIFHKDVMFIVELNDEDLINSPHINENEKKTIQQFLEKLRKK